METRKELAAGLVSWGDDKLSPVGESPPQIKTSCPRGKAPCFLVPIPWSPRKLPAEGFFLLFWSFVYVSASVHWQSKDHVSGTTKAHVFDRLSNE